MRPILPTRSPISTVTAALAVNDIDDNQKDVSVYKNDVKWDLIKTTAADAANITRSQYRRNQRNKCRISCDLHNNQKC